MRKHGWRTPEWKLIVALEPDFHFKPEVELYNLVVDPGENNNLAEKEPGMVAALAAAMDAWIATRREGDRRHQPDVHQPAVARHRDHEGPFTSSQQAYDTLHIGSLTQARGLQQKK